MPADENWVNVKAHFRQAHDELAEAGDLTMENAGYHQVNLVEEIVGRMADIFPFPEPANTTIAEAPIYALEPVQEANALIANNVQQSLLAQMQQMQAMMLQL